MQVFFGFEYLRRYFWYYLLVVEVRRILGDFWSSTNFFFGCGLLEDKVRRIVLRFSQFQVDAISAVSWKLSSGWFFLVFGNPKKKCFWYGMLKGELHRSLIDLWSSKRLILIQSARGWYMQVFYWFWIFKKMFLIRSASGWGAQDSSWFLKF